MVLFQKRMENFSYLFWNNNVLDVLGLWGHLWNSLIINDQSWIAFFSYKNQLSYMRFCSSFSTSWRNGNCFELKDKKTIFSEEKQMSRFQINNMGFLSPTMEWKVYILYGNEATYACMLMNYLNKIINCRWIPPAPINKPFSS